MPVPKGTFKGPINIVYSSIKMTFPNFSKFCTVRRLQFLFWIEAAVLKSFLKDAKVQDARLKAAARRLQLEGCRSYTMYVLH